MRKPTVLIGILSSLLIGGIYQPLRAEDRAGVEVWKAEG
jgi:hypothetical protein